MNKSLIFLTVLFAGCAHQQRCGGNPTAVLDRSTGCHVRIRTVTVGAEQNLPSSLTSNPALLHLEWIEPTYIDGKMVTGHFILTAGDLK